jgi:hypothetical protein
VKCLDDVGDDGRQPLTQRPPVPAARFEHRSRPAGHRHLRTDGPGTTIEQDEAARTATSAWADRMPA